VTYVPGSLVLTASPDPSVTTPLALPDAGTGFGHYDAATRTVCVNLGRGATAWNGGQGGTINPPDKATGTPGDVTYYQFQVTVDEDAGGTTIVNTARLDYATATTRTPAVYNTPPVQTAVGLKADVEIVKTMTPSPAIAGQAGQTVLAVTNHGPNTATGVTITDPMPLKYQATAVTVSDGSTCAVPAPGRPWPARSRTWPPGRP
jgi:uncharacterized repeat protein (TIGR01451 family)